LIVTVTLILWDKNIIYNIAPSNETTNEIVKISNLNRIIIITAVILRTAFLFSYFIVQKHTWQLYYIKDFGFWAVSHHWGMMWICNFIVNRDKLIMKKLWKTGYFKNKNWTFFVHSLWDCQNHQTCTDHCHVLDECLLASLHQHIQIEKWDNQLLLF
jgi:hypothetical protein